MIRRKGAGRSGSEATFLVPADLTPGDYILEVRTRLSQKNLRTGQLEQILTMPAA